MKEQIDFELTWMERGVAALPLVVPTRRDERRATLRRAYMMQRSILRLAQHRETFDDEQRTRLRALMHSIRCWLNRHS